MGREGDPLVDALDRLVRELESAREIASWYRSSPPYFDGPVRTERQGVAEDYEGRIRRFIAEITALVAEANG